MSENGHDERGLRGWFEGLPVPDPGEDDFHVTFACCFCFEDANSDDAVTLNAMGTEEGEVQMWVCHARCLRDALHEGARDFAPFIEEKLD